MLGSYPDRTQLKTLSGLERDPETYTFIRHEEASRNDQKMDSDVGSVIEKGAIEQLKIVTSKFPIVLVLPPVVIIDKL